MASPRCAREKSPAEKRPPGWVPAAFVVNSLWGVQRAIAPVSTSKVMVPASPSTALTDGFDESERS